MILFPPSFALEAGENKDGSQGSGVGGLRPTPAQALRQKIHLRSFQVFS